LYVPRDRKHCVIDVVSPVGHYIQVSMQSCSASGAAATAGLRIQRDIVIKKWSKSQPK